MKLLGVLIVLVCATSTFAQPSAPDVQAAALTPKSWASAGAATRFGGSGLTLAYGQQDLLAPGTDARFGVGYFNAPFTQRASPLN